MKSLFSIFAFVFQLMYFTGFAQCPPPNFPDTGDNCGAPIICDNLDGYCNTINNNNQSRAFPCCPNWTLNNDEWFGFFAGTTSITIEIVPSNCLPGSNGNLGLQAAIYASCPPNNPSNNWCNNNMMDSQCSCTENVIILSSNNYVIGQVYWIVLDGCSGSVCDYQIDVTDGQIQSNPPDDPGAITGSAIVCEGSTTNYEIPSVSGATIYTWTLTPSNAGTIQGNDRDISVVWATGYSGAATLCVKTSNQCFSNPAESCLTIEVIEKPTATISGGGVICTNSGGSVNLTVNLTGEPDWELVYAINGTPQPAIITSSSPYTIVATQPGTYTLASVKSIDSDPDCNGTVSGSAIVTGITLNTSSSVTPAVCGQSNGAVDLSVTGGNSPYSYSWSSGQSSQDLNSVPPGTYTVTITDGNNCSATHSATVNDNIINMTLSAVVTNNSSCTSGNGAINLSVSPAGPYNFNWSNGVTTEDLSNLDGGTYTVSVTQGLTCSASATYTIDNIPNLPNLSASPTNSTCDLPNGSINASVTGGVGPFTFLWSNGATTEDISDIDAGNYELTVTGANDCTSTISVIVNNINTAINLSVIITNNTTCNGGNGSINLVVTPANNYSFSWSNGATTEDIFNLLSGNYSVTVSAGGSCTNEGAFTVIDVLNSPNLSAVQTSSTCELSNGSINATVSNGVAPFTYSWSNGATTEDISGLFAGTYTLTVIGSNGCSNSITSDLVNINPSFNLTGIITNNTACNGGNGSVNLTVTPSNNYTYDWSNGATSEDISNLSSGIYSVTVSAGGACVEEASYTVSDGPNLPSISAIATPSNCNLDNGSINATVTGGNMPYDFIWSNGETTEDIANITGGAYTITVMDASGCTNTLIVNVENLGASFSINANVVHNTSCNGGNGSIDLLVSPFGNYTYIWSNGSTFEDVSNLIAGNFTVTVSEGSCTDEGTFVINNAANQPSVGVTIKLTTCNLNNGGIDVTVTGGAPAYTYLWSNGETTEDLNNLANGVYILTVTDAVNCSSTVSATITGAYPLLGAFILSYANVSCYGGSNGSATVLSSGGDGAYSYLWSSGATTNNVSNLATGNYIVTVTDGTNCTATTSISLVQPDPLLPNASATGETAFQANDGTATSNPIGGTPGYSFSWSNGGTTQTIANLAPGSYTVSVTDTNNCTTVQTVTVNAYGCNIIASISSTNVSCFGNNDGFASVSLFGAANPVSYAWSNGETTQSINNLAPGFYLVNIVDGNGCPAMLSVVISEPPILLANAAATNLSYQGANDGTAIANPTGGNPGYSYVWSNGSSAQNIINLVPGNYTVSVYDGIGCKAVQTVVVNEFGCNILASIVSANLTCHKSNDGLASVTLTGEIYPVTYNWSNGDTTQTINNLSMGVYTVNVIDSNNCRAMLDVFISEPLILLANVQSTNVTGMGINDGEAQANPTGGTPAYSYLWSNGDTTQTITGLAPGIYTVVITDSKGCTVKQNAYVSAFNCSLSAILSITHVRCFGGNDGGAIVELVGGTLPYSYLWNNGHTTQSIEQLSAGAYSITTADAAGCFNFIAFNINQPPNLVAIVTDVQNVECPQDMTGSAHIAASGGVAPYVFYWPGGSSENLGVGSYIVTISDAKACTTTASFAIESTDNQVPEIICPGDIDACGSSIVNYPIAIAQDNCGHPNMPLVIAGLPRVCLKNI